MAVRIRGHGTGSPNGQVSRPALRAKLFCGLPDVAGEEVLQAAQSRQFNEGATVFGQGADANSFFVLLEGRIKVSQVTQAGQQIVLGYVGPGEQFGSLAQFGPDRYPAAAVAVSDGSALVWEKHAMLGLMERHPRLALNALSALAFQLEEAHLRFGEVATLRVEQRIGHALLRLMRQAGRVLQGGIAIDFPISRQDIAEMTGTTLHTVSRVISGWEQGGIVEGRRRHLTVRDPLALQRIAESLSRA